MDVAFPVFKRALSSVLWGMILKALPLLVLIPIIIVVIKSGISTRLIKALTKEEPPPWRHYTEMLVMF
jgi:hypothetical protein